jgi:signal transduction histidine kinase
MTNKPTNKKPVKIEPLTDKIPLLKDSLTEVQQLLSSTKKLTSRIIFGLIVVVISVVLLIFGVMFLVEQFTHVTEDSTVYPWVFVAVSLTVGAVVGTILSFMYSKLTKKTIKPYLDALQRVSEGDFTARIDEESMMFEDTHIAEKFNQMVKKLGSVEILRESFISDFSHEFKTPIVSISGFAKLLKTADLTDEERNEYLDVIINESERLVHLSQSVLLLTRLDDHVVQKQTFLLDEQLRQSVLLFDKTLKDKDIQLDLTVETLPICSSQQLLSNVWLNLIGNAIKFSFDGGKIDIVAKNHGDYVTVAISDQGCGMDEQTQQNIFNKFYQGDKSHSVEGNGLGLPIVQKVLKLVGGDISVQSELGKGSTFTVILPNDKN